MTAARETEKSKVCKSQSTFSLSSILSDKALYSCLHRSVLYKDVALPSSLFPLHSLFSFLSFPHQLLIVFSTHHQLHKILSSHQLISIQLPLYILYTWCSASHTLPHFNMSSSETTTAASIAEVPATPQSTGAPMQEDNATLNTTLNDSSCCSTCAITQSVITLPERVSTIKLMVNKEIETLAQEMRAQRTRDAPQLKFQKLIPGHSASVVYKMD